MLRVSFISAVAVLMACGGSSSEPPARPDFRGGTVYEIFVRSFADSDGDGIGDLEGAAAHLDYLADLGVDAVWLMPIFPSPSYHGYDVTDYRDVNPRYGTLADLDAFVAAAHRRGIAVLLDYVLNHSSSQHPFFVDSRSGPSADKRGYYDWSDTDPHWFRPSGGGSPWYALNGAFYYAYFCNCMPDWNLGNPAVEQELTDSMKFWLARGIDGFRLDAVRYFFESPTGALTDQPETHAYLKRLRAALDAAAPKEVMVAEAWASMGIQASYWGAGDEMQLAFSFDLADALKASAVSGDASSAINTLAVAESTFAGKDRQFEAPFLSNHDQVRVMRTLLSGGADAAAARVAAAALMAMPGTAFIYYGEELGMLGGAGSADEQKRTPFRWTASAPGYGFTVGTPWFAGSESDGVDVASETADPGSLLNLYKALIVLRKQQPALYGGDAKWEMVEGGGTGVLALLRTPASGARVLFVCNFAAAATGAFSVSLPGAPAVLMAEGLTGSPSASAGKLGFVDLSGHGFVFVALT